MRSFILSIASLILTVNTTFGQVALMEQAARLKNYIGKNGVEKAYLHFDKPYYAAGDTIYFKAYIMAGEKNELSLLSGVLHAELIDPQNKVISSVKLPISGGMSIGDFALADSMPAGNYRVRAYTRLMQNHGSDLFFNKTIPIAAIIDKLPKKNSRLVKLTAVPVQTVAAAPDVQFFPEGGDLVTGVNSKVAFKAVAAGGNGMEVTGGIYNSANKLITKIFTTHLGMGTFNFTPAADETYHAELLSTTGNTVTVPLPATNPGGVAIAVTDSVTKISVHINPGKLFYDQNKNQPLGLFIYSGGRLTTVSDVMDGADMRFDIQKAGLSSGITQITLLSAKGEPLCERLVFIDKNDKLPVSIVADKAQYKTRERVQVKLHVDNDADFDPVKAHFSVSVIDRGKVITNPDKEENIITYTLLTSGLKGYIEEPGYYFNNTDDKKRGDLDLVMLTHGYRRFSWKTVDNDSTPSPVINPEKALSINGTAKSVWGKPVSNGIVTLIPSAGGTLLTEKIDKNGAFTFKSLAFYDSTRFILSAVNAKGGNNTELTYQPDPVVPINWQLYATTDTATIPVIQAYLENSKSRHNEFMKYYSKGVELKEVKIKAIKQATYRTLSLAGAGNATQVVHMADVKEGGKLSDALTGHLRIRMYNGIPAVGLIVVDGLWLGPTNIDYLPTGDVETVELLTGANAAIYGISGGQGVLVITTKQGVGREAKDVISRGILPVTVAGFYRAREFYAPRYDKINDHTHPDLRSTIYWLPEIATDKDGNASFDFYNADGNGQYEIIVEGINNKGVTGVAKMTYEVR